MNSPTALVLLLLAVAAHSTVVPRTSPIDSRAPLTYRVQIKDDPLTRWAPIVRDFQEPLQRFIEFVDLIPASHKFYEGVEWYAKNEFKHQEFVKEVEAIATLSQLPFNQLFFLNFMYEFSTIKACSAILVRNSEGTIMHGRNLDFEMWEIFSKLIVHVEYYDGDRKLFAIDHVAGSVFALTGERFGAFSVNVDTRKQDHALQRDFLSILKDNAIPTVWLLRKVLEEQTNYKDATDRLKTTEIGGPVYYIIAGVSANEGMVIERNNKDVHASYELTETRWFLVQTNYDRDQPDPVHDPRRVPAERRLKELGNKDFSETDLLNKIMFLWPTFNIATIKTAIMTPKNSYHNTTVWYGHNPTPKAHLLTA